MRGNATWFWKRKLHKRYLMNAFIECLNHWGGIFLTFAWPMLWQSSLLIAALFALDLLFRRQLRASVRYALWLVVLVKLCVPPTLALPTSPAWWLHKAPPPVVARSLPNYTVTYDNGPLPEIPSTPFPAFVPPKPVMTNAAWFLVVSIAVSSTLLCWLFVRWWQVARMVRSATATEKFSGALDEALRQAGAPSIGSAGPHNHQQRAKPVLGFPNAGRNLVRLKIVERRISPAVCGLLWPVILLPRELVEILSPAQLHAVLLHELIHLRRRDVWLNFMQALLQIVYWWHPLVWLANARIRQVREEAVDDAVMLALRDDADAYAPTLLEVAKLALNRPLVSLGLVGIIESRSALRQRIERLVDFRPPRRAGLTLVSLLEILAFTAFAVPMGEGPTPTNEAITPSAADFTPAESVENTKSISVRINSYFFQLRPADFEKAVSGLKLNDGGKKDSWWLASSGQFQQILNGFTSSRMIPVASPSTEAELGQTIKAVTGNIYTSGIDLICTPTMLDGLINLTLDGTASGRFAIEGKTNFFRADIIARNHEGVILRAANLGGYAESNLMVMIRIQIVTNLDTELMTFGLGMLDQKTTLDNLRRATHLNCTTTQEKVRALHKLFADAGVDLSKSGEAIYIGSSGGFRMHAARKDSAVIQSVLNKLQSQSRPDVTPAVSAQNMNAATGSLSDPNFRVVLKALEQRTGSETLAEPEVTTRSGRGVNKIAMPSILVPISKMDAGQLVQDGKLLYEMGKLDDAEKLLKYALSLDSENATAKSYLGLVQTARVAQKWGITKTERQNIVKQLERIRIPSVSFDHLALGEVVRQLSEAARENDPDKLGVKISTVTNSVSKEPADINSVVINMSAVSDASLADVLDAVVLGTKEPVKYSIMDDGIVFSLRGVAPLYSRHFRVDPNLFIGALHINTGQQTDSVTLMARDYFKTLGVDLNVPGKSVFYGDRLGELFVRATAQDLDTIENALERFSPVTPQIHIKARFLEVPKGTLAGLEKVIAVTNQPAHSNQVAGLVGILTDKNFRAVLHNLEALPDVETLAEPEVVTTSGRQTQMRATQIITVITNSVVEQIVTNPNDVWASADNSIVPQSGALSSSNLARSASANNSIVSQTRVETGPVLDVVPYVLSDGYTINLTVIPSLIEFLGYDAPAPTNSTTTYDRAGKKIDLPKSMPRFTVRQVVATLNLWDNQTAIISGLPEKNFVNGKEVAGKSKASDKELLVFITATIVDPAGNRVHSDDELPFGQNGIPPQPSRTK